MIRWPGRRRRPAREAPGAGAGRDGTAVIRREIRRLTDLNRGRRDREVERRLVELRYDVYRDGVVPAAPTSPPVTVEDRFPGELIPEVPRASLTVELLRSAITHHGSLLVRGLLEPDHTRLLVRDIDRALDAFDAHTRSATPADLRGWYRPFDHPLITDRNRQSKRRTGSILAAESPPALFDLIEVINDAGVGELVERYLGEEPALLARKVTLRRVAHDLGGPFRTGWHQDGAFMGAGTRPLNVWAALTPCGDDAPGLDVAGRRFDELLPTGDGAYAAWGIRADVAEAAAEGVTVRPVFEAGDALIFDHLCLHRTAAEAGMTNDRHAVETWFFAPSTYAAMTAENTNGYSPRDQVPLAF